MNWRAMVLGMCVVGLLGLTGCSEGEAEGESSSKELETIRFVDTGAEGMEELKREFEPFRAELEKTLDKKVEFFSISSRTAAATAMEFDQVDLVLTGPGEYVLMKSKVDVTPVVGITRPGYKSVIVVHADSDIRRAEDLKGKTIAMKDVGSTSGHVGPSQLLMENGLDLDKDLKVMMLGDARVEAFKNREVDALATSLKSYNDLVADEGEGKYRILLEGEELPNDLFVANPNLSKEQVEELRQQMLENQEALLKSMLVTGEHDHYKESSFIEAKDEDYDALRAVYQSLNIELE